MKNKIYATFAMLMIMGSVIVSCENNVEDMTLPYVEKLVISGLIEPDSGAVLKITKTLPPLSESSDYYLHNPEPTITIKSGDDTWILESDYEDMSDGWYSNKSIPVEYGKTYTLEARWKHLVAKATTTIPYPPTMEFVTFKKRNTDYGYQDWIYYVNFKPAGNAVYRAGAYDLSYGFYNYGYGYELNNGKNKNAAGNCIIGAPDYGIGLSPEIVKTQFIFFLDAFDTPYEKFFNSRNEGDSPNDIFGMGGININGNIEGDGIGAFIGRVRVAKPAEELIK